MLSVLTPFIGSQLIIVASLLLSAILSPLTFHKTFSGDFLDFMSLFSNVSLNISTSLQGVISTLIILRFTSDFDEFKQKISLRHILKTVFCFICMRSREEEEDQRVSIQDEINEGDEERETKRPILERKQTTTTHNNQHKQQNKNSKKWASPVSIIAKEIRESSEAQEETQDDTFGSLDYSYADRIESK